MDYPLSQAAQLDLYNGKFDDGVPGVRAASVIPSATTNAIVDELLGIIDAAGIAPDEANLTQLLAALRSEGVFQTPAQFDSSTKAATAQFVQRALGNKAGVVIIGDPAILDTSHAGKYIICSVTTGNLTLPDITTMGEGATLWIEAGNQPVQLNTQGGTDMVGQSIPDGSSTFVVQANAIIEITAAVANGTYRVNGGSAPALIADNGYLKLTSGLIIQWGRTASIVQGGNSIESLPIAYPNAHLRAYGSVALANTQNGSSCGALNYDTSHIQLWNASANTVNFAVDWLSIGY